MKVGDKVTTSGVVTHVSVELAWITLDGTCASGDYRIDRKALRAPSRSNVHVAVGDRVQMLQGTVLAVDEGLAHVRVPGVARQPWLPAESLKVVPPKRPAGAGDI